MFNGIIEEKGVILARTNRAKETDFNIKASIILEGVKIGHSIAVNGVCLTVTTIAEWGFVATAVCETLSKSTLGVLKIKDSVNLERAMCYGARVDGHLVQGHVDGTGLITNIASVGGGAEIQVKIPDDLILYCVAKGSIAIDGISLTIASLKGNEVTVAVIPHTIENTNLSDKKVRDPVNIETDIIGRYIERFLTKSFPKESLTIDRMREWGYGKYQAGL